MSAMKVGATVGNFFFPGLGYLLAVPHKRLQGAIFLLGAFGLTYVEQIAIGPDHAAFMPMFVTVFVMNTAFAIDAWQEVSALEAKSPASA